MVHEGPPALQQSPAPLAPLPLLCYSHLLRTNDWMETHAFSEVVKVQTFCQTLVAEARL